MKKAVAIGSLAGAAVIAAGVAVWQQQGPGARATAAGLDAYVPADTVFYMGGSPNSSVIKLMDGYPLTGVDPAEISLLFEGLAQREGGLPAAAKLFEALLLDFTRNVTTYGDLARHYGMDLSHEQAVYMHGMFPVVRMPIADAEAFNGVWSRASEEAGLTPSEEQVAGAKVQRWRLTPPGVADYIDLVVAQDKQLATVTLFSALDTPEQQQERLGLRKPAHSLAESGELSAIHSNYGFDGSFAGFLHLQRLAQSVLETENSLLAVDLQRLSAKSGKPNPVTGNLDQTCRQEIAGLFAGAPRLVLGYTDIATKGDTINLGARSIFEIANQQVSESLLALRGHLPGHVDDDQLFGLAVATDMDKLVPTLMKLWQQAGEVKFSCPQLQQFQQQLKTTSPAPLGVATGMMQGIKGFGMSLYGLEFSDPALVEAGDAAVRPDLLVSLATENPELVISLLNTTLVAQSGGRLEPLPLDGSARELDLGELVPGLSATFAKSGQHLVFYSGEKSSAAAAKLKDELLEPNGVLAASIDYPTLGRMVEQLPLATLAQMGQGDTDLCMAQARMRQMIAGMPVNEKIRVDLERSGVVSDIRMRMQPTEASAKVGDLAGRYELLDVGTECGVAESIGTEEINSDGSGHYVEADNETGCDLLEYNYRWTREGQRMLFEVQDGRYRDGCDMEWEALEAHTATCELLPHPDGFECIYKDDEGEGLYRYRRLP